MEIGKRIYEFRKKIGLSQMQLADELNVTRQTISNWELGQTTPDINQAKALANIFNVSLDELVENDVKDVIVKKLINTEKMTNKIMEILKCFIIVVIGWTAIMVIAISIHNNHIKSEQMKIAENEAKNQKYLESLKKVDYLGEINGNEFIISPQYDGNNSIFAINCHSIKTNEKYNGSYEINKEILEHIDGYNYKGMQLNKFVEETKIFFESKEGSFRLITKYLPATENATSHIVGSLPAGTYTFYVTPYTNVSGTYFYAIQFYTI